MIFHELGKAGCTYTPPFPTQVLLSATPLNGDDIFATNLFNFQMRLKLRFPLAIFTCVCVCVRGVVCVFLVLFFFCACFGCAVLLFFALCTVRFRISK